MTTAVDDSHYFRVAVFFLADFAAVFAAGLAVAVLVAVFGAAAAVFAVPFRPRDGLRGAGVGVSAKSVDFAATCGATGALIGES
jgi:hypothetical protein